MSEIKRVIDHIASDKQRVKDRRVSSHRAIVELFCAGQHREAQRIERVVNYVLIVLALAGVAVWAAWKAGALA